MTARFLQLHTLTSYPATLLNRDDAGFAKRMPFGGAVRTRVSSQCLKRHWRTFNGDGSLASLEAPESIRSRISFERFVYEPLVKAGQAEGVARAVTDKLVGKVFGSEDKQKKADAQPKKKKGGKDKPEGEDSAVPEATTGGAGTAQVTVLGRPELDYLYGLALQACREGGSEDKAVKALETLLSDKKLKENLKALKPGSLEAGLGAALFGRMVTGDILSRTDAAIHVAHAMTVHAQATESDYFSAIDDLVRDDGASESGHINASELTSGLFYGYVVVDVEGLVSNLGGDRKLAGDVVRSLVKTIATVSPGAKKGSTAPYAYSHLVLAEAGRAQPRTLANAFLEPVPMRGNLVDASYVALAGYLKDLDAMYGSDPRVHAGIRTGDRFGAPGISLADLATWSVARVTE